MGREYISGPKARVRFDKNEKKSTLPSKGRVPIIDICSKFKAYGYGNIKTGKVNYLQRKLQVENEFVSIHASYQSISSQYPSWQGKAF